MSDKSEIEVNYPALVHIICIWWENSEFRDIRGRLHGMALMVNNDDDVEDELVLLRNIAAHHAFSQTVEDFIS